MVANQAVIDINAMTHDEFRAFVTQGQIALYDEVVQTLNGLIKIADEKIASVVKIKGHAGNPARLP